MKVSLKLSFAIQAQPEPLIYSIRRRGKSSKWQFELRRVQKDRRSELSSEHDNCRSIKIKPSRINSIHVYAETATHSSSSSSSAMQHNLIFHPPAKLLDRFDTSIFFLSIYSNCCYTVY